MNGNEYVDYEEKNYDRLVEAFIRKYPAEWIDLVDADMADHIEPPQHEGEDR